MKSSSILSAALTATGAAAAWVVLSRRRRVQRQDRTVAVCVDGDDVRAVALRSGLGLDRMLELVAGHGATHLSLRELSLGRLLASGGVGLSHQRTPASRNASNRQAFATRRLAISTLVMDRNGTGGKSPEMRRGRL